jgi:hypothetical protein
MREEISKEAAKRSKGRADAPPLKVLDLHPTLSQLSEEELWKGGHEGYDANGEVPGSELCFDMHYRIDDVYILFAVKLKEVLLSYTVIDAKMSAKDLTFRELFEVFDASGDGYVSIEEFREGITLLELDIEYSWIRSIVREIDTEGDGYIGVEELQAALRGTYEFNGSQGSEWKIWVNPAHQVLVYYNVLTKEEIFENDLTSKKLDIICRANLIAREEVKEREDILVRKREDFKERMEAWAANGLRRFYYVWSAREEMKKHRYLIEQRQLIRSKKAEKRVALLWQNAYRKRCAKKRSWFRVNVTYQKKASYEEQGRLFYENHITSVSNWERPSFFLFFLNFGSVDVDEPLPWSVQYRDASGEQFWYNRLNQEELPIETKPDGYPLCPVCCIELALRDCTTCQYSYCWTCFRREHDFVGGDSHVWTMTAPLVCGLCHTNLAGKRAKGNDFCQPCFARLEKGGVFKGKAVGLIENI